MYHGYYDLARMPFQGAPDPDFLYLGPAHQEALAALEYGIAAGMGFVMLTGDVGLGKTTLVRSYLQQAMPDDRVVIYVYHPVLSFRALLAVIAEELGLPVDEPDPHQLVRRIQRNLIERFTSGQRVVLVIDEAQRLPEETLENLRLISNLETNQSKLLQIVIVGQPELEQLLSSRELRALDQRIGLRARLRPLTRAETIEYIEHRLRQAGSTDPQQIISPAAMRLIALQSGGVPRRINTIADLALIHGFGLGERPLGPSAVRAVRSLPGHGAAPRQAIGRLLRSVPSLSAGLAIAALLVVLLLALGRPAPSSDLFSGSGEVAYVVTAPEAMSALAQRLYGRNAVAAIGAITRHNPGLGADTLLSDGQVVFLPMPSATP